MAMRDHLNHVAKLKAKIVTVDPPTGVIEAVGPDRQVRQVALFAVPPGFTWPVEGEYWSIYEENGYWRLGEKFLSPDERAKLQSLQPGDRWGTTPEPWQTLPLASNWTAYGGLYETPSFYRDALDIVRCKAPITNVDVYTFGGGAADLFTLPTGYRPSGRRILLCSGFDTGPGNCIFHVIVDQTGLVWLDSTTPSGASGAIGATVFLDTFAFRAEG